jgi:hypothetical protein
VEQVEMVGARPMSRENGGCARKQGGNEAGCLDPTDDAAQAPFAASERP